jgi:glutamine synthetase
MLMAGIDGVKHKADPGAPLDKDIYGLPPEEVASVPLMPASLEEAIECLQGDHEFLLEGDVFLRDSIENWIEYKMKKEADAMRLRPHPHEFELYFDI